MSQANKEQIRILSTYMQQNPDLARSYNALSSTARTAQRQQWEKLVRTLNTIGPPTKTVAEWKRIWTLRKYSAKKKFTHNKNSLKKTGGGPFDLKLLDETDEAIVAACGIEASVSGIKNSLSFGNIGKETVTNENAYNVDDDIEQLLEDLNGEPELNILQDSTNTPISSTPKRRQTNVKEKQDILQQQIELQKKFFANQMENSNKANNTLLEIWDSLRELCNAKNRQTDSHNSLKKEELEVRRMELDVAKLANDIKLMELNNSKS